MHAPRTCAGASNQYSSISANEKAARYFFNISSKPENTKMLTVFHTLIVCICLQDTTGTTPTQPGNCTRARRLDRGGALPPCEAHLRPHFGNPRSVHLGKEGKIFSHSGALKHHGASERQPLDVQVCSPRKIGRGKFLFKASRSTAAGLLDTCSNFDSVRPASV